MLKTMDIMEEEEFPIAGWKSIQSALNGYAVNSSNLRKITSAKTAPDVFLRDTRYHLIERHNRENALPHAH